MLIGDGDGGGSAVDGRLDGRRKPLTSHSCKGNTLFAVCSHSLSRFLFVGTSLILMSFICSLTRLFIDIYFLFASFSPLLFFLTLSLFSLSIAALFFSLNNNLFIHFNL